MLYLATASGPKVCSAISEGLLGQMVTPNSGNRLVEGARWALDNGTVRIVGGLPVRDPEWSPDQWRRTLDRYQGDDRCLFAVVPDWVGDSARTDDCWATYAGEVTARGYKAAYVTQNGCAAIPTGASAVFTGGDDTWKLGQAARALVAEASRGGVWCHMGRVNTRSRLRKAHADGYDSVDGTTLGFGPDRNLPIVLRWLRELDHPQLPLAR